MKPDLRGVNQWGTGKYTELRNRQEIPRRKTRGERFTQAKQDKKTYRTMVSLTPDQVEFARGYGKGRLSTGLRIILNMVKMSGATPEDIAENANGTAYHSLNLEIQRLKKDVKFLLESIGPKPKRSRKKRIEFPASTTTED